MASNTITRPELEQGVETRGIERVLGRAEAEVVLAIWDCNGAGTPTRKQDGRRR